jgi:hypothetical protein
MNQDSSQYQVVFMPGGKKARRFMGKSKGKEEQEKIW